MSPRNLKETILALLNRTHLQTAAGMLLSLKEHGTRYNQTSVYRALDQLVASGVICRHYFNDNQAWYELQTHHHAHLWCSGCGQVTATDCEYQQPKRVGTFAVDHHHVTLVGLCQNCQQLAPTSQATE